MAGGHEHAGADAPFAHRGLTAGPLPRRCKAGIVVARFNAAVTQPLLEGAVDTLLDDGRYDASEIAVMDVPGCVEIPLAAQALARQEHTELVVVLGCVIRGETAHFDYVCDVVTSGVRQVMLAEHIPVGFGVLTTETAAQAHSRAEAAADGRNAGADAASAALAMVASLEGETAPQSTGLGFG